MKTVNSQWKPGQIKWFSGRRFRVRRLSPCVITKKSICLNCNIECAYTPPCELSQDVHCLRKLPADCYFKVDPRTPVITEEN